MAFNPQQRFGAGSPTSMAASSVNTTPAGGWGFLKDIDWGEFMFGSPAEGGQPGMGSKAGMILNALQGFGGMYLGAKNLGLAKDSLRENRRQFDLNFGAQQKLTNKQLHDQAAARAAANPGAPSPAEQMTKWGI